MKYWYVLMLLLPFLGKAQEKEGKGGLHVSEPGAYTMIVLPDPQTYVKFGRNQPLFDLLIAWIKDQRKALNIQMVLCTGDMVEENNIIRPDSINGDQTSFEQWRFVSNAFGKLDGIVPYILCAGNHEYGFKAAENRYSQFNSFFPPQKNPLNATLLKGMAPNAQQIPTMENAWYEWRSPLGQDFLFFSLEFGPRKNILEWARNIAAQKEHRQSIGLLLTHSFLNSDGNRTDKEPYPLADANYGKVIWDSLVFPSSNILFTVSGHIANSDQHRDMVGFREDVNSAGRQVHQMMFNAQREGGGWHGNGGDGWIRILEFLPDGKTVKVYTFSPFFYISPSTRNLAWRTAPYDQFTINY